MNLDLTIWFKSAFEYSTERIEHEMNMFSEGNPPFAA